MAMNRMTLNHQVASFYDLMTAPANKILDHFFESEPLKVSTAAKPEKMAGRC